MKKRILSVIICIFLLLSLTACGESSFTPSQKAFDKKVQSSVPSTDEVIAKNDKYTLQFDSATGGIIIVDNATGTVWQTCPKPEGEQELDAMGMPIKRHGFPQSVLEVGYMDKTISGGGNLVATTYDGVSGGSGRMVYKPMKDGKGVTIEYYFDLQEIMIPVDYVLYDDYVSITVDSKRIQENSLKVTYVSIAPFLSSIPNDSEDSYLFYPSGSGAILSSDSYNDQGHIYNAYVYGDDLTMEERYIATDETSIRLPVYGYKQGEKGGFVIIDDGAETAILNANCGNTAYKFSTVFPSFQLRGYTSHLATSFNNTRNANIFPEYMIEGKFSIRFYPLSGENANYGGMADIYRNYLVKECGLSETDNDKAMSVSLIGGTEITKSFLGVPYKTLYAATSLDQANTIISELSESVDSLAVKFKGYGTSGVDKGKIGGGFKIGGNFGSASQLKKIADSFGKKVDLYMNYELVEFASSGSGFAYFGDTVMNSGSIKADQFIIDKALRNNEEKMKYRLLRPIKFDDAVSKSLKTNSNWNLNGVSFDSFTNLTYSDYSNIKSSVDYNSKHNFDKAVSDALKQVKDSKQKLMANNANAYAAIVADIVENAPIASDNGFAFMENVPFYAMVFKGYVPMTSEPINTAVTPERVVLGAVEGGMGLNYTVIAQWDNSLINSLYPYFNTTVYSSIKEDILSTYNDLADYYKSIKGAKITSNKIISDGVHSTSFDNGVTVYVNYNNNAAQTPAGEIAALDYIITGGAE
ncbi:MAG: hypothetical protein E7521_05565 [Ruminococcaceae bacterium]|nr:hypothetical protein [Oscillospiraceae bacterium]